MKKSTLVIIVAVIAVLAVGGIVAATTMKKDKNESSEAAPTNTSNPDDMASMDQQSSSTPVPSPSSSDAAVSAVSIQDFSYSPAKVTVKKGTKVTWTNKDSTKHDVTPDTSGAFPKSDLLAQGESYSHTFDTVGTFTYHCSPHPYMKGTIEVTE